MYLIEELKIKPFAQMKVITFMSLYGINGQRYLSFIQMLTKESLQEFAVLLLISVIDQDGTTKIDYKINSRK